MHSFDEVETQSAASDDGDDSSSSDGPSRSGGFLTDDHIAAGQEAVATGSLVPNNNPPGMGRKA